MNRFTECGTHDQAVIGDGAAFRHTQFRRKIKRFKIFVKKYFFCDDAFVSLAREHPYNAFLISIVNEKDLSDRKESGAAADAGGYFRRPKLHGP